MGKVALAVCCPCRCLASMLSTCFFTLLASLVVAAGVLMLLFYLFFHPRMVTATADSASLAQFNLGPDSVLAYNLTVAVTVSNPNARLGLYYDAVESLAYFDNHRFGYAQLPSFAQPSGASTRLAPAFQGRQPLDGDLAAATFRLQESGGVFTVEVTLDAALRMKVWFFKVPVPRLKVFCALDVPEPGNTAVLFQPTKCAVLI